MKSVTYNFHSLLHSADLLDEKLRKMLAPHGIQPRQARILDALNRIGPTSQTTLTIEFDVTAGSMSTMISRMISKGLVMRERHPGQLRTDVLKITPEGQAKLDLVYSVWSEMDRLLEEIIGVRKSQRLAELTTELRIALGGHIPGEPVSGKNEAD